MALILLYCQHCSKAVLLTILWIYDFMHVKSVSGFIPVYHSWEGLVNPVVNMFLINITTFPQQRCPYFDVVVGLAWSKDHDSYAGVA